MRRLLPFSSFAMLLSFAVGVTIGTTLCNNQSQIVKSLLSSLDTNSTLTRNTNEGNSDAAAKLIDEVLQHSLESYTRMTEAHHVLAVCLLVRASFEYQYILEWIFYHYLMGFQHVYLYENVDKVVADAVDSASSAEFVHGTKAAASRLYTLLEPLIDADYITYALIAGEHYAAQELQIQHCWSSGLKKKQALWLANFDADEFLVYLPLLSRSWSEWSSGYQNDNILLYAYLWSFRARNESILVVDRLDFSGWPWLHPVSSEILVLEAFNYTMVRDGSGRLWGKVIALVSTVDEKTANTHYIRPQRGPLQTAYVSTPCHQHLSPLQEEFPTGYQCYEPLRFHHYSRSFTDCLTKLTEKLKATSSDPSRVGWRVQAGAQWCQIAYNGSDLLKNDIFSRATTSTTPSVPTLFDMLRRMKTRFLRRDFNIEPVLP